MPFSSHPAAKAGEADRTPTRVATSRHRKEREKVVIVELPRPEKQSSTNFDLTRPIHKFTLFGTLAAPPGAFYQSPPQSPRTACANAKSATAAVSARRIRGP